MNNRKLTEEEFDTAIDYLNDLEQATEKVNKKHHKNENYSFTCHFHKENLSYQIIKNTSYAYEKLDLPRYKINIYSEDERIASIDSENAEELKLKLAGWMIENSDLLEGSEEEII